MKRRVYVVETTIVSVFSLFRRPTVLRKVYRRRWRARLRFWLDNIPIPTTCGVFMQSRLIEEWPDDNVISLSSRRAA